MFQKLGSSITTGSIHSERKLVHIKENKTGEMMVMVVVIIIVDNSHEILDKRVKRLVQSKDIFP